MKLCLIYFFLTLIMTIKIKKEDKVTKTKGNNIGINLYNSGVVLQSMKRPLHWFVNVMIEKPNDRYFEEAEYNGLRYQTERLRDNLDREYNDYVRNYYDEKMRSYAQKFKK